LSRPEIHPAVEHMPNLHGLVAEWAYPKIWEAVLAVIVGVAVWVTGRKTASFEWGLAGVMAGGVLVGIHTYMADCALLVPGITLLTQARSVESRLLGILMGTPVPYICLHVKGSTILPTAARCALILLILLMAREAGREGGRHEVRQPAI
jgi:hypothetical protein